MILMKLTKLFSMSLMPRRPTKIKYRFQVYYLVLLKKSAVTRE